MSSSGGQRFIQVPFIAFKEAVPEGTEFPQAAAPVAQALLIVLELKFLIRRVRA